LKGEVLLQGFGPILQFLQIYLRDPGDEWDSGLGQGGGEVVP